jgi:hypothetical protein
MFVTGRVDGVVEITTRGLVASAGGLFHSLVHSILIESPRTNWRVWFVPAEVHLSIVVAAAPTRHTHNPSPTTNTRHIAPFPISEAPKKLGSTQFYPDRPTQKYKFADFPPRLSG